MKYYNDKKYYIKRALKVAKLCNNVDAIYALTILSRHNNIISLDCAKEINNLNYKNINLFNIEGENK